jgi:hypothetical protein
MSRMCGTVSKVHGMAVRCHDCHLHGRPDRFCAAEFPPRKGKRLTQSTRHWEFRSFRSYEKVNPVSTKSTADIITVKFAKQLLLFSASDPSRGLEPAGVHR